MPDSRISPIRWKLVPDDGLDIIVKSSETN